MREITKQMIDYYKIRELNCDFMGYELQRKDKYTFHHLLAHKNECESRHIPNDGYVWWNGSILCGKSSHPYVHLIEDYDKDMYKKLTFYMQNMNFYGKLDKENLMKIRDVLEQFEKEHSGNRKIKELYTKRKKSIDIFL